MTDKIKKKLEFLKKKEYKKQRISADSINVENFTELDRHIEMFKDVFKYEEPILFDKDDLFGFNRHTTFKSPARGGNVTPDYGRVFSEGFDKITDDIKNAMDNCDDNEKRNYGATMLELLGIWMEVADEYRDFAKKEGNIKLYNALCNVPRRGAGSLYEACVFMKMCAYFLRLYGTELLTMGRFDQYMYPFYLKDKAAGVSDEEIFEMLEEFFISLNYDTDLYHGEQQGDNGQSMVLGGFNADGEWMYNELSQMCMQASLELSVIDPKINLRVGKNTPDEIYEYATLLTKQGLGFPQYCNDDIIVPGLIKLGYSKEDAINYSVAACWECIVPGHGSDVPNIGTMDFPAVVNRAIIKNLMKAESFDQLLESVNREIKEEADDIIEEMSKRKLKFMPLLSVFMNGCVESLTDMWRNGTKYLNFGCHGAGIANAADALAAVKKNIYDEKTIGKQTLIDALESNFADCVEIKNMLKNSPKMGNNDDFTDGIALEIMRTFAENMNNRANGHGGIWRAGTGSALEYMEKGQLCPATADGRGAYEPYSSSYSPSIGAKTNGLLSVIQSFTKFDLTDIINGGPLTIELHDTVLKNDIGVKKTAMLVKKYIQLGGHQLQLNSLNKDRLIDAQKNPELYGDLIVRVWGWSGYFNELDVKYQNHIISRCDYSL